MVGVMLASFVDVDEEWAFGGANRVHSSLFYISLGDMTGPYQLFAKYVLC